MNEQTIDEVVEHIIKNRGPDLGRLAHPKIKRLSYGILSKALDRIHADTAWGLDYIKPWHFRDIVGIWEGEEGKENLRQLTGEVIKSLQEKNQWTLIEVVTKITQADFNRDLSLNTSNGTISYNAQSGMKRVYEGSTYKAIKNWVDNHPDERVRLGYAGIKPWHFAMTNRDTWHGEKGKENARILTGEIIEKLMKDYDWNLDDVIKNIKESDFKSKLVFETPDGKIEYDAYSSLRQAYIGSPSAAVIDWVKHHPDDRTRHGYADLRPWHFREVPKGTWKGEKGKENARIIVGELLEYLMKKNTWSMRDIISEFSAKDFHHKLQLQTPNGLIEYDAREAFFYGYRQSPSAGIIDWIQNNPDEKIRVGYVNIKPWHFGRRPLNTWRGPEGKENARQVVGDVIENLMRKNNWTLRDVIENVQSSDFSVDLELQTSDGVIKYDAFSPLLITYNDSPSTAIIDWIRHHPDAKIREGYSQIQPWHFRKAPFGFWIGHKGKENARAWAGEVVNKIMAKNNWSIDDLVRNVTAEHFQETHDIETPDGKLEYSSTRFMFLYGNSPSQAILDWIKHHPNKAIRQKYSFLTPSHFSHSLERRKSRLSGRLGKYDIKKARKPDGFYDLSIYGFTQFNAPDKAAVRELIVESAQDILGKRKIKYLGLETENFESLRHIYEVLKLDSSGSAIVERSPRVYNAMLAMQQYSREGKRILKGASILQGDLEEQIYNVHGPFNFVNLDWVGHLSKDKEDTIAKLFKNGLLDDESVVYVTLHDAPLAQVRSQKAGYNQNQREEISGLMKKYSQQKFKVQHLFDLPYNGGTNGKDTTPMVTCGFKISRMQ